MSAIITTGTADAPYRLPQKEVKEFVHNLFESHSNIDRMISVFDNSNVSERHFSKPVEWFKEQHTFAERNEVFIETALDLSYKCISECLSKAGASAEDIDHIIYVSSTGLATPSIDALLLNKFKFNSHIKRTPIWGLGCAAGAAGLSRAYEFTRAFPSKTVLVVAVELCSLTFLKNDLSKSNIVATSLFSDGAAAVLISGHENRLSQQHKIKILDTLSTTYYDSLDVMGWDIVESGFKVVFSRDIPTIVKDYVKPNIEELLTKHGLSVSDIKHYIAHPGGLKVINAYQESVNLTNGALDYSRKILKEHGNMSSPSVLYVLNEFLTQNKFGKGEYGLITALGPGFSSELLLFIT